MLQWRDDIGGTQDMPRRKKNYGNPIATARDIDEAKEKRDELEAVALEAGREVHLKIGRIAQVRGYDDNHIWGLFYDEEDQA